MSALSIQVPFPVFQDRDGQPLDNGYVWLGVANLYPITNPVVAYFDEALTIIAAQPLRTINGYISNAGTPAQVFVDGVNFSILVQDSKGSMVYNFSDGTGISPDACDITYDPPFTGGVAYPVCEKLEQTVSFKDFGAVGDGVTDDKAAVKLALESGFIVDGGGSTYAINGTCTPTSFVGLQNANFIQIGNNTATNFQTLNIVGFSNFFIDNVTINMGTNVTTLFSDDGNSGLYVGGSAYNSESRNFRISRVTVTGNGCGSGIQVRHSERFTVDNCLVHNRISGSSPDPTNDSQNGIQIVNCANAIVSNCNVYNLKTRLSGVDTNKWTRGFLFVEIRDSTIVGCNSTATDQAYDFSGAYVAATNFIGNRRFVISSCTANNSGTFGFKFANVTRDGLVTGCIANNTATIGFVFSPSGVALPAGLEKYNTQNIDVVGCKVVNVLGTGWSGANAQGFRVQSNPTYVDYPRAIRLKDCSVIDTQDTPTTIDGYVSDALTPLYPTVGYDTSVANTTQGCTVSSTVTSPFDNDIGPNLCVVTGSTTQSIPNNAYTSLTWDVNITDPTRLHNTVTNNSNIYIKTSGWYLVSAQVTFSANSAGLRSIRLLKNGSTIDRTTVIFPPVAGFGVSANTSIVIELISGDYIAAAAFQDSGGALNAQNNESQLSVALVS